jgi:hypothetical protein
LYDSKLEVNTTLGASVGVNHAPDAATYPKASGIGLGATSTSYTVASGGGTISFVGGAGMYAENTALSGNPTNLVFWTNLAGTPAEAMRITSGGNVGIGCNPGYKLDVQASVAGYVFNSQNTRNVSGDGNALFLLGNNANNTSSYFIICSMASGDKMYVYGNGNIVNINNSYGALSDIKLKENIEDATPKLDDLMKVKIRNYNLIGQEIKQIGVIAQELQEVFPAMVDESADFEEIEITDEEGNTTKEKQPTGTTTKSVKYSVFVPMLIKAIQEQQSQIESLKAEIQTLKQ